MRVEDIQSIKNVPDKSQPQILRRGEFFVSEVLEVKGDTVLLRNAQGALLTARLLGELWLAAGDHVETVVDEAQGSRYVLRLVDVSRGEGQAEDAVIKDPTSAAAHHARAQILPGMLAMMKRNAGLEPKMAEFMAKNGIPGTPENIETLSRLVKGELKADRLILDIHQEAAQTQPPRAEQPAGNEGVLVRDAHAPTGTAAENARPVAVPNTDSAQPQTVQTNGAGNGDAALLQPAKMPWENPAAPQGHPAPAIPENPSPQAQALFPETNQSKNDTTAAEKAMGRQPMQMESVPQATKTEGARQPVAEQAPPMGAAGHDGIPDQEIPKAAALARQLLSFVVDMGDKKTLPARLKKTVEELPAHVKELKLSLQHSDNNDRTMMRHAESLDKQLTLMSAFKRFDCYHIPLTGPNREPTTAELYVFRHKRRRATAGPEHYAVLLGLDMPYLGRVETMIRAAGRNVTLDFRLEKAELADALAGEAKALEAAISDMGFILTDISARELAVRTTALNAEDAEPQAQMPGPGGLDMRI